MKRTTCSVLAALVLLGGVSGCGPSTSDLMAEAVNLYQIEMYPAARARLEGVIDREPGNTAALFYMARAYHAEKFYEQAIFYYQCCLAADPVYPKAGEYLRQAQGEAGKSGKTLQIIPNLDEE